jgi:hypothetical protein
MEAQGITNISNLVRLQVSIGRRIAVVVHRKDKEASKAHSSTTVRFQLARKLYGAVRIAGMANLPQVQQVIVAMDISLASRIVQGFQ